MYIIITTIKISTTRKIRVLNNMSDLYKIAFLTYKKQKVLERLKDYKSKDQIKKGCK